MRTVYHLGKAAFSISPLTAKLYCHHILTDVGGDDGERIQIRLAHVLGQSAGIIFKVPKQLCCAPLCLLDQFPVALVTSVQQGTAHLEQVLKGQKREHRERQVGAVTSTGNSGILFHHGGKTGA